MKNTVAIAILFLGGLLVYGGYRDMSFADTLRLITGQPTDQGTDMTLDPNSVPHKSVGKGTEGSRSDNGTSNKLPPNFTPESK